MPVEIRTAVALLTESPLDDAVAAVTAVDLALLIAARTGTPVQRPEIALFARLDRTVTAAQKNCLTRRRTHLAREAVKVADVTLFSSFRDSVAADRYGNTRNRKGRRRAG